VNLYIYFWVFFLPFARTQLLCTDSSVIVFPEDGGTILYNPIIPSFRLTYPNSEFYVECDFESVGEVDPVNFNDITTYDLSKLIYSHNCTPDYNISVAENITQNILVNYTAWVLILQNTLPNNAIITFKFTLWGKNHTSIFFDPTQLLNVNPGSFQMDITISNWNYTKSNSRIQLSVRLTAGTSLLSLFAGYFNDGQLKRVEVSGSTDNLAIDLSEMAVVFNDVNTTYLPVILSTSVVGLSPPEGILNLIFPNVPGNYSFGTRCAVEFEVFSSTPNLTLAIVLGVLGGVVLLFALGGLGFFILYKKYPHLWGLQELRDSNIEM